MKRVAALCLVLVLFATVALRDLDAFVRSGLGRFTVMITVIVRGAMNVIFDEAML